MANPNIDVLGPPPSYDSVVYGTDGGSGPVHPGSDLPPPQYPSAPSDYPSAAPYTYPPVPPNYPVNQTYPAAPTQYPSTYNTVPAQRTTIVYANEEPRPTTNVVNRICFTIFFIIFIIAIISILWNVIF